MSINRWRSNREPSRANVLLVEGLDEVNVFSSILKDINRDDIDVLNIGGKDKLATEFVSLILSSKFRQVRAFGIVQDADNDSTAAFERVKGVLTTNKFVAPKTPGTFVDSGERRVGILILPGPNRNGYLEDLFLDSLKGTAGSACVDSFADCSQAAGFTPFDSKRRAYAFLAALAAPEPRLGRAFESGKVNGNHPSYDLVKDFLNLLT